MLVGSAMFGTTLTWLHAEKFRYWELFGELVNFGVCVLKIGFFEVHTCLYRHNGFTGDGKHPL